MRAGHLISLSAFGLEAAASGDERGMTHDMEIYEVRRELVMRYFQDHHQRCLLS